MDRRFLLGVVFLFVAHPRAEAAPTYVHAECVKCHKGREASDGETAVSIWQKSWHQKSSDDLIPAKLSASPKRKATMDKLLAANPGKKTFLTDARCTSCHLTKVGSSQLGIVCESCHGPGSAYKDAHQEAGGYEKSVAGLGMKDLRNLDVRAEDCLGCHLASGSAKIRGISPDVINEVIAQGHPPMDTFDFAAEVQKASVFHWPKAKAKGGGETASALTQAGKAAAAKIPPLPGAVARVQEAPPPVAPTAVPAADPPRSVQQPVLETRAVEPAVPSGAVPTPTPGRRPGGARSKPPEESANLGTSARTQTTDGGSREAAGQPASSGGGTEPAVPRLAPVAEPTRPVPPTATPFPGPESIERLTSPEAALLLQSYVIQVLNRALAERPPETLPARPDWRASPMLRGSSRAERLLELQRETLILQRLALGGSVPTPTPQGPVP